GPADCRSRAVLPRRLASSCWPCGSAWLARWLPDAAKKRVRREAGPLGCWVGSGLLLGVHPDVGQDDDRGVERFAADVDAHHVGAGVKQRALGSGAAAEEAATAAAGHEGHRLRAAGRAASALSATGAATAAL